MITTVTDKEREQAATIERLTTELESRLDNDLDKILAMNDEQVTALTRLDGSNPDDVAALARKAMQCAVLTVERDELRADLDAERDAAELKSACITGMRQEITAWSVTVENLEAELESKLDSDLEKIAAERYKVVPAHESMFHRWAVVAGDGTQQLYLGREAECQNMARKFAGAFLDGAYLARQLRQEVTAWSVTAENLEAELERERIRLAACGVVALSDTPDSAAKARQMLPEYESASCDDVKRRVDECMALRAERDALKALNLKLAIGVVALAYEADALFSVDEARELMNPFESQLNSIFSGEPSFEDQVCSILKEANHD